jgi:N-ethylmaleimide reductase
METYYAQRAGAGLIIAEGTSPSPNGAGYSNMPGLYNQTQLDAWKKITEAVHANKGLIFLQVMHTGRISHINNVPEGARVICPSAIAHKGETSTYDIGKQPYTIPEEMSLKDIQSTINEFSECAKMAIKAGFDGIEIHSAHGYLPNQFLNQSSNMRKDDYGGSHENRMRFLLEVIEASIRAIGAQKVGLRISPYSYADTEDDKDDIYALYSELANELNNYDLSYLHLSHMGDPEPIKFELWKTIRKNYMGNLMLCGDFTKESAEKALQNEDADLISFGRDFIANPDLMERFKNDWPLAERDRTCWYTQGPEGLIDYPFYKE